MTTATTNSMTPPTPTPARRPRPPTPVRLKTDKAVIKAMPAVAVVVAVDGVVVVAAAGNTNASAKQYPAADSCALGVASVGAGARKSSFSTFGSWVDLAAPGESIYSPVPTDGYAWWSGTSMATPHLAGLLLACSVSSGGTVIGDPDTKPDTIGVH